MSQIIIVKSSDITVNNNGAGGFTLSYNGNSKLYISSLYNLAQTNSTQDEIINDFVIYLNAIPIEK